MAEAIAAAVEFEAERMTLSAELSQVLTAGDSAGLLKLLSSHDQTNGHVTINVRATEAPDAAPPRGPVTSSCCLLGVTSNGNTALHLVASRGHAEPAALICKSAPSLVATRNRSLDTPLHCAARGGHREVAACLLSTMLNSGIEEAAALEATNRLGDTALHEAVRHGHAEVVDLIMEKAPDLASVTSDDGVSALYLAATTKSEQMVRLLLRPLPDGTPSPASSAGREGRTALHVAAAVSKEMVQDILAWNPEGPALLTRVDCLGRSPLHFAVRVANLSVVELFQNINSHLAHISDKHGCYPVHYAAGRGPYDSISVINELIKRCPDYYELVDEKGRNLLHVAVVTQNDNLVGYICQNERFTMLLNMTDYKGNTPLHLAAKYGHTSIVSILLQSTRVKVNINNTDGLTALDLARGTFPGRRLHYYLEPAFMVYSCLRLVGANGGLDYFSLLSDLHRKDESSEEESIEKDFTKGTIASALIASVTFTAAITVPGGFIADDHPHSGTAILARRFAFRAFVLSDTVAFLCSIVATGFLIYGSISEIPRNLRCQYNATSFMLVPTAAQFMIAAFAFGLHLVLGTANHWLLTFVYMVSSASVLFVSSNTWIPLHIYGFAKAIWRRHGWKGLLNMHNPPSSPVKLFWRLLWSPLAMFSGGSFALPMCATFFVAMALEIALPNY